MKNSMGTYNGFFSKNYFKRKLNLAKSFIKTNLPIILSKTLWYMKKLENYFTEHGILTCVIIGILGLIVSYNSFAVLSFTFIAILFCLINKYISLQRDRFYLTRDFSSAIKQLDDIIAECMTEYTIFNNYDKEDSYITEAEQDKIREELTNMVSSKISNVLIKKLSLYYNSESIYTIIAMKINVFIMNYVITNNKISDSKTIKQGTASDDANESSTIPFILRNQK